MNEERKYFHSDTCYKRYLYMKRFTDQINDMLDKGYIVFDNDGEMILPDSRFVYDEGSIALRQSSTFRISYCGCTFDDDDLIYMLEKEFSFKEIKKMFAKFKYVDPKHIKQLKLKKQFIHNEKCEHEWVITGAGFTVCKKCKTID